MAANESGSRFDNIKGLMANPRTRTPLVLSVTVVAILAIWGALRWSAGTPEPVAGSATVPPASSGTRTTPGTSTNEAYNALVRQHDVQEATAASTTGKSFVPVLTGAAPPPDMHDPFSSLPQQQLPTPAPPPAAPPPVQQNPQQSYVPSPQDSRDKYEKAEKQVLGYLGLWKPVDGEQEFAYNGKRQSAQATAGETSMAAGHGLPSPSATAQSATSQSATPKQVYIRAGTVVPAILLTPINSDAPGPVLAQITSGPFRNARVLGSFRSSGQQLVVQFDTLSMPGQPHSFRIQAFAVGSDLSPGLATNVDHHYLLRYGLISAAAFLQGYGQAEQQSGQTTIVSPFGGVTQTTGKLSASQISRRALGQVGQSVGTELQQDASRPNTVTASGQDGGALPIGLLFTSDF